MLAALIPGVTQVETKKNFWESEIIDNARRWIATHLQTRVSVDAAESAEPLDSLSS